MDETLLVGAICASRQGWQQANAIGLDEGDFGEAARCVVAAANEQYTRDPELQAIDHEVLRAQVVRRFSDGGMADSVMSFVSGFPTDVSNVNIIEEYRLLRLARCSTTLATLLATGQHGDETFTLLDKYRQLAAGGTETEHYKHRLTVEDFQADGEARIAIAPKSLNDFIGGGVLRGHNITVYGRPDSGKSLFALNQAAYACKEGKRVLYVANEEPAQDITRRLLSRLAGCDVFALRDPEVVGRAIEFAGFAYDNWFLYHRAGVTARDIGRQCAKIKPDFLIIDQLKNVACASDNRALQLDTLARQVREIGIEHNCVTMSITQAGESAHNKLVLGMTDIEWSNTGIPGAADLLVGIGLDPEFEATNKRMISIPKNKVNGQHGAFHVWIDPKKTAFLSKKQVSGGGI